KNGHHFGQYILEKSKCGLITDAKSVVLVGPACTRKFGINGQNFFGMTGHLDFRNDGNAFSGSVGNQPAYFCLGVKTTAGIGLTDFEVTTAVTPPVFPYRMRTPGRPVGEFGVLVDLQSPTGPTRKLPMKCIELVKCHQINELFQKGEWIEVVGNIKMESPVTET